MTVGTMRLRTLGSSASALVRFTFEYGSGVLFVFFFILGICLLGTLFFLGRGDVAVAVAWAVA